jgi:UDP-2-acetamido-3-amino-2,3-dideoxy-glucuronate N-acetyltransferase
MVARSAEVVVIGCGAWGRNHVRTFAELGALRGVSDAEMSRAEEFGALYGVPAMSVSDALGDEAVRAVVIATSAETHAGIAHDALRAGKDVFVEKPLALDPAGARVLCELADSTGRVLMVGHLLRYHPAFVALHGLVADGALGRLQYVYSNRLNLGRFRREENILWSFAPHDISMILALVGAMPDAVSATAATYLHKTIADVTTTHLSFPGGQRAHVFVSWLHPFKEQKLVVVGDRAMAVLDDSAPWPTKLVLFEHRVDWPGGVPTAIRAEGRPVEVAPDEPLRLECEHFLDRIASRERPLTDGWEGLRVLEVLDRAQRSLDEERTDRTPPVALPGIHESSYVDDGAEVGQGTRIWHFSHVLPGSSIGRDCNIGQNVVIGPNVRIGDRVRIQNNVSVYEGVTLEDGVFCGPSCVFTNVLNPRAEVERKKEFRSTVVRRGATIGANATIVCGNEIGAYAMVAAGAVVTHKVQAHAVVAGVPARWIGWASHDGEVLGDDLICPRSGRRYRVDDQRLVEIS